MRSATRTPHREGRAGEADIVRLIRCPNCGCRLMPLPRSYPLYDVQCTGCLFRAQVKTNNCKPKSRIFGSGWDILSKNRRAGHLVPPLIVNFKWVEGGRKRRRVMFFPFLSTSNLQPRVRSKRGQRPQYKEFNYVGLLDETTPRVVLRDVW